jgi:two-component system phosphate regulon sensor histidine kinase PhoR
MPWILLTVAVIAIIALNGWWRRRVRALELECETRITELTRLGHQSALEIQAQQEAIFNSMIEGLLLLDENGRILLANRAFTSLFDLEADVRSRTILEALRLHELAELVDFLGRQKSVSGYELEIPGAVERSVQVNGAAVFNGNGERHGTILVFHDLTRLKQLESARTEFVANVSHELRTPLSLIKGYVETLIDGAKDDPEVAGKFLQTIDRNAERLKLLIEDLLTISELESGRLRLNVQAVKLRALVDKVFEEYESRAHTRKMELMNECPELEVHADAARLEQVLDNLVDNAIKYGREQGSVRAAARLQGEHVEVFIRDDGPGIPAESLPRVFERFYRVDKARSREQGGTGLGLSIVKHIVQSHGGKVWAKSETGQGTTFYFTLPLQAGGTQPRLL